MKKFPALALLAIATAWRPASASEQITTGPENGTYIEIGRDISTYVAAPAGIALEVLPSKGSSENVYRLRADGSVRLGLLQSDVYNAFVDQSREGNPEAAYLIAPLRVVMPLYREELYFVVRADSPMRDIQDIRDKRINVGVQGSGTALSATTIYQKMFDAGIAVKNASFLSNEDALRALVDDRSVDVVVIVAGQPASLFARMRPEAARYIKLLRADPQAPETAAASESYALSLIHASSYAAWLSTDVPTFSTRALLVTNDLQPAPSRRMLARLAASWCVNRGELVSHGHSKWREVDASLPALGRGWLYYEPTRQVLATCDSKRVNRLLAAPR